MERTGKKRTDNSDLELVKLALKEDQGAFSALLAKYRTSLLTYVMKFVNVAEDAEDICQKSFVKAFMNISRYDHRYAFSTWLYNIAQNEAIDHLRRNRNSISAVSISGENEAMNLAANSTPEDEFIIEQAVSQLKYCIGRLPEDYSAVAELRFIKDFAYEDIARELSIPLGTVKTRINRARKMLVEAVEKSGNGRDS